MTMSINLPLEIKVPYGDHGRLHFFHPSLQFQAFCQGELVVVVITTLLINRRTWHPL